MSCEREKKTISILSNQYEDKKKRTCSQVCIERYFEQASKQTQFLDFFLSLHSSIIKNLFVTNEQKQECEQ